METELRTYTLRDPHGYVAHSTDDPVEAATHLDEDSDLRPDDFTKTEIRDRAKALRAGEREAEKAAKRADDDRRRSIARRAEELTEKPELLAYAVAELEARLRVG